jgi:ketosteroid isomerase-like protein
MNIYFSAVILVLVSPFFAFGQSEKDIQEIKGTLESWNRGWAEKNVDLAIRDYSEHVDWTNAFGDRFQSQKELKEGLEFIFGLDFVMAGSSGKNEFEDVGFLGANVVLLRSKLIRKGQKNAQGKVMPDRHINHLRVYNRIDGKWKIVSHMISQAQPKSLPKGERKK